MQILNIALFSFLIICALSTHTADALWGKEKPHTEKSQEAAYESAEKAREAAGKAYEAAKEGTLGAGERISDTAGAAREKVGSVGEKMADTVGGAFHGAREGVGNVYEGAREGAGNIYEGAKQRIQDTAEDIRERAAHITGMASEGSDQVRGKAEDLYDEASERAQYMKYKSQSWLSYFWDRFCDVILFVPRTVSHAFSWSWQTSCDVAHDRYSQARQRAGDARDKAGQFYEGARERAGDLRNQAGEYVDQARERVGNTYEDVKERASETAQGAKERVGEAGEEVKGYGESILDRAGQAKDTIVGQGKKAADVISDKLNQAGEYVRGGPGQFQQGSEQMFERAREMGEQGKERVGQSKGWVMCQMERAAKLLLSLGILSLLLIVPFFFLLSPQRQKQFRERASQFSNNVRQRASPYMPNMPNFGFLRRQPQAHQQGGKQVHTSTSTEKQVLPASEATGTTIPVKHIEQETKTVHEEKTEEGPGGRTGYALRGRVEERDR